MRYFILLAALCCFSSSFSQESSSYKTWISQFAEIQLKDSVLLSVPAQPPAGNEEEAVKKYISPLYYPAAAGSNTYSYHILGKMTANREYDIVLLYKYNSSDKYAIRNVFLVTLNKKNGKLLHFQMVAANTVFQNDRANTVGWFYKGNRFTLITDSRIKGAETHSVVEFSIHNQGTIVPKPQPGASKEHHD